MCRIRTLCPPSHSAWQQALTTAVRVDVSAGPGADCQASARCVPWRNRFGDCQCRPLLCFTCLGEISTRRTQLCARTCRRTATGRGRPTSSLSWPGSGLSGPRQRVAFVWKYVRFPVRSPARRWLSPLEETRDAAGIRRLDATMTQLRPVQLSGCAGRSPVRGCHWVSLGPPGRAQRSHVCPVMCGGLQSYEWPVRSPVTRGRRRAAGARCPYRERARQRHRSS